MQNMYLQGRRIDVDCCGICNQNHSRSHWQFYD